MNNTSKKTKAAATPVLTRRRQSLRPLTTIELSQVAGGYAPPTGGWKPAA